MILYKIGCKHLSHVINNDFPHRFIINYKKNILIIAVNMLRLKNKW